MLCITLVTFFLFLSVLANNFYQAQYKLVFERANIVRHTDKFGCKVDIKAFKYNRTDTAVNASYYTPVGYGNDLYVIAQAYKFSSNEYREFPLRFSFSICETLKENDFGIRNSLKCGNFTGCPVQKGYYEICNFAPDYSRFPPHIPSGRYMVELQLMYFNEEVLMLQGYAAIKYPEI